MGPLTLALLLLTSGLSRGKPAMDGQFGRGEIQVDLRMPGVQPQVDDTYLCLPKQVHDSVVYITGFIPHANMSTAHHMLLYGCEQPGEEDKVWNCGEMASSNPRFSVAPVCQSGAQIVYAWAMGAPKLELPQDVAFRVGSQTRIKWLVLQIHYKDASSFVPPYNERDESGVILNVVQTPKPKTAGVYLLATGGQILPRSTVYMEAACPYEEDIILHPFAFRVHAHTHGEVISGYRVRDNKWEEIGRKSPKVEEMFYNATHPDMDVKKGDILAARCTMTNNGTQIIHIGSTQNDEMCNFYMMYWVEGDRLPMEEYCYTDGPPAWSWADLVNIEGVPKDASLVPGQEVALEQKLLEENVAEGVNEIFTEEEMKLKEEEGFDDLLTSLMSKLQLLVDNPELPDDEYNNYYWNNLVATDYDKIPSPDDLLYNEYLEPGEWPIYDDVVPLQDDWQARREALMNQYAGNLLLEEYHPLVEESIADRLQRRLNRYRRSRW